MILKNQGEFITSEEDLLITVTCSLIQDTTRALTHRAETYQTRIHRGYIMTLDMHQILSLSGLQLNPI